MQEFIIIGMIDFPILCARALMFPLSLNIRARRRRQRRETTPPEITWNRDRVCLVLDCDAERALIGPPAVSQLLIESIDRAARAQKLPFPAKGHAKGGELSPAARASDINRRINERRNSARLNDDSMTNFIEFQPRAPTRSSRDQWSMILPRSRIEIRWNSSTFKERELARSLSSLRSIRAERAERINFRGRNRVGRPFLQEIKGQLEIRGAD